MEIIDLATVPVPQVVDTYAKVFAGPEWFEVEKCAACGKAYPGPVESRRSDVWAPGSACWSCDQPLVLRSFYLDPDDRLGERIVNDAADQDRYIGVGAKLDDELVALSWGYAMPTLDSPSVKFVSVRQELADAGVDADSLFYAAETAVLPDHQRQGIGGALASARLQRAADAGFTTAAFRTIDRVRLVGLWKKVLGTDAVTELFADPDPAKDQVWFIGSLDALSHSD